METVCIMCPLGCSLKIEDSNGMIAVTGNLCKKGEAYGKTEFSDPKRMVTTLIRTVSGKIKSVKTAAPIQKNKIFELLELIKNTTISDELKVGDIAIKNALLQSDIIITGE